MLWTPATPMTGQPNYIGEWFPDTTGFSLVNAKYLTHQPIGLLWCCFTIALYASLSRVPNLNLIWASLAVPWWNPDLVSQALFFRSNFFGRGSEPHAVSHIVFFIYYISQVFFCALSFSLQLFSFCFFVCWNFSIFFCFYSMGHKVWPSSIPLYLTQSNPVVCQFHFQVSLRGCLFPLQLWPPRCLAIRFG